MLTKIAVLLLLAVGFSSAAELCDEGSQAGVLKAEEDLATARASGDVRTMASLTSDDLIAIAPDGSIASRADLYFSWGLEPLGHGRQSGGSMLRVRVCRGGAIVIHELLDHKTSITDVWVRNRSNSVGGTPWKLVASQLNNIQDSDGILKYLVILAATAALAGVSASRHVELSKQMRALTGEYRETRSEFRHDYYDRLKSVEYQVGFFKARCERSARGQLWLYLALVAELVIFFINFVWPQLLPNGLFCVPFGFVAVAIVFHFLEHWHAFETIDKETQDVLKPQGSKANPWIAWLYRLFG